jgi:hypothetical protein
VRGAAALLGSRLRTRLPPLPSPPFNSSSSRETRPRVINCG